MAHDYPDILDKPDNSTYLRGVGTEAPMSLVQVPSKRMAKVIAPSVDDVVNLFVARNSHRPVAVKGDAVARIKDLLRQIADSLEEATATAPPADIDAGEGLAAPLAPGEGHRRLGAYATPMTLADWAGEVAGPTELARRYGISRSTLHDWMSRGAVIGLLAGVRKHVFPVAQFIDGRPVEGLDTIVAAAGSPRTAWLWLVEPHPSLGGATPLDRLKAGGQAAVRDLAARDFGQS